MASAQQNLARFQEIARRGLQDKLSPEIRQRFDEAVRRGLVQMPGAAAEPAEPTRAELMLQRAQQMQQQGITPEALSPEQKLAYARTQTTLQQPAPTSVWDAFTQGLKFGAQTVGTGAGLLGAEAFGQDETAELIRASRDISEQQLSAAREEFPISTLAGEITGEVSTLGGVGGAGAGAGLRLARGAAPVARGAAAGAGAGLAEGVVAGYGRGQAIPEAAFGGLLGAVLGGAGPAVFSAFRGLKSSSPQVAQSAEVKVKDYVANRIRSEYGRDPTKAELEQITTAIRDSNAEDLARLAMPETPAAKEAERLALFEAEEIPTTRGRITQKAEDLERELRLERAQSAGPATEALTEARIAESEGIRSAINRQMADLGVPEQAGETVKESLLGLQSSMASERRQAYQKLADMVEDVDKLPISTAATDDRVGIRGAVYDALFGELPVTEETRKALASAAARFGVIGDIGEATQRGTIFEIPYEGGTITTTRPPEALNAANFEDFRKALNRASQNDKTGAVSEVIRQLDQSLDEATDAWGNSLNADAIAQAQEARRMFRTEKQLFENKDLIQRLTGVKQGSTTPQVYSSETVKEILKPSTATEEVVKLVDTLQKGGKGTQRALANLQANSINQLLENSFSTMSNRMAGEQLFNHIAFAKEFDKALPKLKVLFKDNPAKLKSLENIREISTLMTKDRTNVGSDTARNLLGQLKTLGAGLAKFPVIGNTLVGAISGASDYGRQVAERTRIPVGTIKKSKQERSLEKRINAELQGYPKLSAFFRYGVGPVGREEARRLTREDEQP